MATAPDDNERLSYRDLADRLGVSPDAARMKAKRKVKAGLWRIIPGNHPSDRVLVELPSNDLNVRAGRVGTVHPAQKPAQTPEHTPNSITERLLDELAAASARNDHLTDRLIEAKDVLGTAYDKLITLNQELVSARIELIAAKDEVVAANDKIVEAKEAHQRDAVDLAAAEMREMGTKAELERALADCKTLRREHEQALGSLTVLKRNLAYHRNRSLWQKLIGR